VLNAPYALPPAGIMAILAGSPGLAREALDRLRALGTRGRAVDANRLAIEAGISAFDGDFSASLAGFRQAISMLREIGLPWDGVWVTMAALSCLGTEPETLGWATGAADFLKQIGGDAGRRTARQTRRCFTGSSVPCEDVAAFGTERRRGGHE